MPVAGLGRVKTLRWTGSESREVGYLVGVIERTGRHERHEPRLSHFSRNNRRWRGLDRRRYELCTLHRYRHRFHCCWGDQCFERASPPGAVIGQQRWLVQHNRWFRHRSHRGLVGAPTYRRRIGLPHSMEAVRPVASRLGLRSSTARRGKPLRKRNATARAVEGNLGGFCVCVAAKHRNGPGSPQAAAPSFSNAEVFNRLRSRTPAAACRRICSATSSRKLGRSE